MTIRLTLISFVALTVLMFQGARAETATRVQDVIICKSPGKIDAAAGKSASAGKAVRTLRVYETKEKAESGESLDGCRATYSKTNVEQTVGTSRQIQQCQSILFGIQKNLEASNWSCRRAGSMAVLKSAAAETSEAQALAVPEKLPENTGPKSVVQ